MIGSAPLRLVVFDTPLSVCKVTGIADVDLGHELVFFAHTADELSLVCPTDIVPRLTIAREDGWRAFRIVGTLDFGLVGILARISRVLADDGIALLALSTFDTDYVLVEERNLERALCALEVAGVALRD